MRNPIRYSGLIISLVLMLGAGAARAQTYPERPIKFVNPTTPGTTADVLARSLAEAMSKVLKESIIVENKPGAEQMIGFEHIAKGAPADGYTVGVIGTDGQALLPLVRKNLRFDPVKDLTLVAGLGEVRYVLAGPGTAPYKTFKELVDAAKAVPGRFNYGSSTPQARLYTLALAQKLDLDMVHVPFAGGGPYLTALIADTVNWGVIAEGTANGLKPRLRIYAVSGTTRSAANPDVPTFTELGFPWFNGGAYALAVRAGTPQAIIDKLSAAAATAMATPEMQSSAQKVLFSLHHLNTEAVTRDFNERSRFYQELANKADIKPE